MFICWARLGVHQVVVRIRGGRAGHTLRALRGIVLGTVRNPSCDLGGLVAAEAFAVSRRFAPLDCEVKLTGRLQIRTSHNKGGSTAKSIQTNSRSRGYRKGAQGRRVFRCVCDCAWCDALFPG
jgi:hypothetical protein